VNENNILLSQLAATETADDARREFLRKAGRLAAYTPPVMLALMYPGAHAVASGGPGGGHGGGGGSRR